MGKRRTTKKMGDDWSSSDPDFVGGDWRWIITNRLREDESQFGSALALAGTQLRRLSPISLTRQQIVDYYESLLSESYEDWHGMNEATREADVTKKSIEGELLAAERRIATLESEIDLLMQQVSKTGRRLYGLLGLIEAQPDNKFGYSLSRRGMSPRGD